MQVLLLLLPFPNNIIDECGFTISNEVHYELRTLKGLRCIAVHFTVRVLFPVVHY